MVRSSSIGSPWFPTRTTGRHLELAAAMIVFAVIPLGDALTILRADGRTSAALGIHGATALVMLFGAALLLAS